MTESSSDVVWDARFLGDIRVVGGGRTVDRFRSRANVILLARLAMVDGRAVAREELAGQLWPNADARSALRSLSTELHALRRELEPEGIERRSIIEASNRDIRLVGKRVAVDALQFETLITSGLRAGVDLRSLEPLRRAIALYEGEFLPGHYDNWSVATRIRLEGQLVQALERAIALSARDSLDDAVTFARRAAAIDPWNEGFRRQVIRLLREAGDRMAARHEASTLDAWLATEGITPEESTRALIDEVLRESVGHGWKPATSEATVASGPEPKPVSPATLTVAILFVDDAVDSRSANLSAAFERSILHHGGRHEHASTAAMVASFERATDAVGAAIETIRAGGGWPSAMEPPGDGVTGGSFASIGRIAIHTAEASERAGVRKRLALAMATALPSGSVVCSAATAVLAGPWLDPAVRLVDVGEFELGRPATSVRMYSIVPMLSGDPKDLLIKAPRVGVSSLPHPTSPMFGRAGELAAVVRAFHRDEARLVTVTGPGGIGKSRLALEVVRELFEFASGRVWIVDTDELDDVQSVVDAALRTVRVEPPTSGSPRAALMEWLRAQSGGLLVFDGFERAVERGGTELIADLIRQVPELRCLVTSRRRLNIDAESWHVLGPLPTPSPGAPADTASLLEFASVALFVERARSVAPEFRLDDSNAAAVAAICHRLDGFPLAIVLAAAQVGVLDVADLLRRLSDSFAILRSRQRDIPARQRTLEDTMAWSVDLLSEDTRAVLAGITVFHGDFDIEAAEAIIDDPLVIDHLAALEESSLLSVTRTSDGIRFHVPEVIRSQIVEILDVDELAHRSRHARYFAEWIAEVCETASNAPGPDVLRRLDVERENIRSALGCLIDVGDHEIALRLAAAVWRQWASRGWYRYGYDLILKLLDTTTTGDRLLRARAEHGAGTLAYRLGDYRASIGHYSEARDGFEAEGDLAGVAYAGNNLAMFAQLAGDLETAAREYAKALEIKSRLADHAGMARGHLNLANVAFELGDYAAALSNVKACIALQRARDDSAGLAASHGLLGSIAEDMADVDAARDAYVLGIDFARAARSSHAEAQGLRKLASWTRDYGDPVESETLYRRALSISMRTDDIAGQAEAQAGLAAVLADLGRLAEARELIDASLSSLDSLGNESGIVRALLVAGQVGIEEGDAEAARSALRHSLAMLRSGSDERRLIEAIEAFSGLADLVGRHDAATALRDACAATRERIGFPRSPNVSAVLARWEDVAGAADRPAQSRKGARLELVEAIDLASSI